MFRIFEFSFANYQRTLLCSGLKAANQYDQKSWSLRHPVVDLVVVAKPVKHKEWVLLMERVNYSTENGAPTKKCKIIPAGVLHVEVG